MAQFGAIIIAFLFIPLLNRYKFKLSTSIGLTSIILGLISGMGLKKFAITIVETTRDPSSINTVLTVMMVGILGGLMKHYNLLDKIVDSMLKIVNNKRTILMIIPPMMGMLSLPGGAALSAPFANNMGEELDVSPPRRAAINLTFRHLAVFLLPYNPQFLLIDNIFPEVNIYILIALNLIIVASILGLSYFLFIKDIEPIIVEKEKTSFKNIINVIIFTSPIYISVIINSIFGIPFYLGMIVSVLIVYLLSDRKEFLQVITKSINWDAIITIGGILLIKGLILNMDGLLSFIEGMFSLTNSSIGILGIFMLVTGFFGMITGNSSVPLAISLPILSLMNIPLNILYGYLFFIFGIGFFGYYFSPIHLCQVLTIQEMGIKTGDIYREYKLYAPLVVATFLIATLGLFLVL